jgi:hypothetical protein
VCGALLGDPGISSQRRVLLKAQAFMTKIQVTLSDRGEYRERRGPENDSRLSRPDGWVIKKRMKRNILLEFKRTSDASKTYHTDYEKDSGHTKHAHLDGVRP